MDLQPGQVCTVYCQGPNYFGDQLGAGCPATNLDPTKVINWLPPTCYCREPVPPPAGYLLGSAPNTYTCAPGYYGRANYRCVVDTTTCEPIITMTGCNLLAQCAKPRVPGRHNAIFDCHIGNTKFIKFPCFFSSSTAEMTILGQTSLHGSSISFWMPMPEKNHTHNHTRTHTFDNVLLTLPQICENLSHMT